MASMKPVISVGRLALGGQGGEEARDQHADLTLEDLDQHAARAWPRSESVPRTVD